jgi:crossover junction endodeoxyribonuclease RuvC
MVLGVDPSITSTGLATIATTATGLAVTARRTQTTPTGPAYAAKRARMMTQIAAIKTAAFITDLVILEGPSLASKGNATRDLAGFWWLTFDALHRHQRVGVVAPAVLKKWCTGSGNADKFAVGQAIARRWPDIVLRSHDEADALVLASIGLHRLGVLPWTPTAYQTEQLTRVEWVDPVE